MTFNCPIGLVMIEPHSAMCMGNGEWEPHPREVVCTLSGGPVIIYYNNYRAI